MTARESTAIPLEAWLDLLLAELPADSPRPAAAEQAAILDLARVAAHASERIAAPISAFMAGMALASRGGDERAAALQTLVRKIEGRVEG